MERDLLSEDKVWRALQSLVAEVMEFEVSRNASAFQSFYHSRCLHVTLVLNTTTVQRDTMSQEGGTASNFHNSLCFAVISFLASCKGAAKRVYNLIEV